jgi:hypothetical protein
MPVAIDISFDFRSDTPKGRDPDRYSETLRRYHQVLWSKPLPSDDMFWLDSRTPRAYLHHKSAIGEFFLSSDSVIPTFKWNADVKKFIPQAELETFNTVGYTIGGMMLFPANRIGGKWTINQARGCTRKIGDRFDLTVECIRRHYQREWSPLAACLDRYGSFFDLFRDFRGYTEFFLLQDMVSSDFREVRISEPFDNFKGSPIPANLAQYETYRRAAVDFIMARNWRVAATPV